MNIQIVEKIIRFQFFFLDNVVKIAKNLLGVLWQDKIGVQKTRLKTGFVLQNIYFCHKTPEYQKTGFKSEIIKFKHFYSFYKGDTKEVHWIRKWK